MSLTPFQLSMQQKERKRREEDAYAQGISEAQVAAHHLSPTIKGFFGDLPLLPIIEEGSLLGAAVDTPAAKRSLYD